MNQTLNFSHQIEPPIQSYFLTLLNNANPNSILYFSPESKIEEILRWRQYQVLSLIQRNLSPMIVPESKRYKELKNSNSEALLEQESVKQKENASIITKIEIDLCESEGSFSIRTDFTKKEEYTSKPVNEYLEQLIKNILHFLIERLGKAQPEEIEHQRSIYSQNNLLLELFDTLVTKYTSHGKSKEDMVRHVLRKALSHLAKCLRVREKVSLRAALVRLCRKYLQNNEKFIKNGERKLHDETNILNLLLPYKKNSRFKTANMNFIREIFASKEFCNDYVDYLDKLDDILETDNKERIQKLTKFLKKCIEENTIYKIKKYSRMPWLSHWQNSTKIIAQELLYTAIK